MLARIPTSLCVCVCVSVCLQVWETFATSDESSGVLGESVSYRQDPAYLELKAERSECLWKAIERRLPNIRDDGVCSVVQVRDSPTL